MLHSKCYISRTNRSIAVKFWQASFEGWYWNSSRTTYVRYGRLFSPCVIIDSFILHSYLVKMLKPKVSNEKKESVCKYIEKIDWKIHILYKFQIFGFSAMMFQNFYSFALFHVLKLLLFLRRLVHVCKYSIFLKYNTLNSSCLRNTHLLIDTH